jgi:hypothetical protein
MSSGKSAGVAGDNPGSSILTQLGAMADGWSRWRGRRFNHTHSILVNGHFDLGFVKIDWKQKTDIMKIPHARQGNRKFAMSQYCERQATTPQEKAMPCD